MTKASRRKASPQRPRSSYARKSRTRPTGHDANGADHRSKPEADNSKQRQVLSMLRQPSGVTVDAIMQRTGWQQHSVRGFLAGVVRKRLKLTLVSNKTNGERTYRVEEDARSLKSQRVRARP